MGSIKLGSDGVFRQVAHWVTMTPKNNREWHAKGDATKAKKKTDPNNVEGYLASLTPERRKEVEAKMPKKSYVNFQRIAAEPETDPAKSETIHNLMVRERLTYEQARQRVNSTKEKTND